MISDPSDKNKSKHKYDLFPLRPHRRNALAAALNAVAHLSPTLPTPANNNWPPSKQPRYSPFAIPSPDPAKEFEYLYRRFTEAEEKYRLQKLSSPK